MTKEAPLKSAYELAMERLRAEDKDRGIAESKPLSDAQKEAIAELKRQAQAKLAELEIAHDKDRPVAAADPEQLTKLEEHYETDRRRIDASLASAIARVRGGEIVDSL